MAFSRARYDANLAAGIRGGLGPGENPALMSFAQAAADAFGVTEANLLATAAASPALYALVQQLGACPWSTPIARGAGLHDLGLAIANTSGLDDAAMQTSLAQQVVAALLPAAVRLVKAKANAAQKVDLEAKAVAIANAQVPTKILSDAASASADIVRVAVRLANAQDPAIPALAAVVSAANVAGFALTATDPVVGMRVIGFLIEQASRAGGGDQPMTACASAAITVAAAAPAKAAAAKTGG